jgi:hypothetical protein
MKNWNVLAVLYLEEKLPDLFSSDCVVGQVMSKVNEIGDKWDELAVQTERKLCILKDVRTLHQFNCVCQDLVGYFVIYLCTYYSVFDPLSVT